MLMWKAPAGSAKVGGTTPLPGATAAAAPVPLLLPPRVSARENMSLMSPPPLHPAPTVFRNNQVGNKRGTDSAP